MTYLLSIAMVLAMTLYQQPTPTPRLNMTEYWSSDTAKYESFRLKVLNNSDSLVVIERVHPSCGCVLASIQRTRSTKDTAADIYVAVTVDRLSPDQPTAIDVFTNRNREVPMRLNIYKGPKPEEKPD